VSPSEDAPPTASSPYRVRRGIHFALTEGRVVLLDVPADRYFCLPEDLDLAFRALAEAGSDFAPEAIEQLLREDIITTSSEGAPFMPAAAPVPCAELPSPLPPAPVSAIAETARFLLVASAAERFLSLEARLHRLQVLGSAAASAEPWEAEAAERFASARTMLPFGRKCLRDSFALLHFLGRGRARARLVIGVTMDPFGAHAWVQAGETVLNDRVDRVCAFTPILVA
jgi:hypothetical protein